MEIQDEGAILNYDWVYIIGWEAQSILLLPFMPPALTIFGTLSQYKLCLAMFASSTMSINNLVLQDVSICTQFLFD